MEVQLIWLDVQARLHHVVFGRRLGSEAAEGSDVGSFFGTTAPREVAATVRIFCQISATNLRATPCSVGGRVTESGTASILCMSPYKIKECVAEDVTRDVTGSRGDFDWVALQTLVNVNTVWTPATSSICLYRFTWLRRA